MKSDSPKLKVSVIIPTYNCAKFIVAAVESALGQTQRPHEIIVVDDGSTDETSDLLSQFGPPVLVIRQENKGQSAARNAALAVATGDAIMLLDADDMLLPDCIESTARQLDTHPDVDVIYSDVELVDGAGQCLGRFSEIYPAKRPSGMILGALGYAWSVITPSTTLIRRSALKDIEFDSSLSFSGADDFEFWRCLAGKSQFLYFDKVVGCYRCHSGQMSANRFAASLEGALEVQRRIMAMPEFADVSSWQQSRLFCHHAARLAMLGQCDAARRMIRRAVATWPLNATAVSLLGISTLGNRALQFTVLKRRELVCGKINRLIAGTAVLPKAVTQSSLATHAANAAPCCLADGGTHG